MAQCGCLTKRRSRPVSSAKQSLEAPRTDKGSSGERRSQNDKIINHLKDEIKRSNNEKDELGVKGLEDEPTSMGDGTNRVGQMTSHTETERGVLTDGYGGGEIHVNETNNPFTKEGAEQREKELATTEIQAVMRSIGAQDRCCLCEGCVRKQHDRELKRSTKEIVDNIANKIERMTWPEQVDRSKVAFTQQRPKRRKRDNALKQLMCGRLRE